MLSPFGYLKALFEFLRLSVESKFPSLSSRRAISTTLAAAAIVGIIAVGGVVVYILVISTGAPSSSTYP